MGAGMRQLQQEALPGGQRARPGALFSAGQLGWGEGPCRERFYRNKPHSWPLEQQLYLRPRTWAQMATGQLDTVRPRLALHLGMTAMKEG